MQLTDLQRKLDTYAKLDETKLVRLGVKGSSVLEIEEFRERRGGVFAGRTGTRYKQYNGLWQHEWDGLIEPVHNLVTNEGLAYVIDVAFDNVADIDTWYVTIGTTNTTPLSTHTYAAPGITEASGANLNETVRQAWVEGASAGTTTRSIDNSASPAIYTGDNSFTAYGAQLKGGGTAPTTLADTAGGGTMYCASLFAASLAMTVDSTIEVTYTVSATDDGV